MTKIFSFTKSKKRESDFLMKRILKYPAVRAARKWQSIKRCPSFHSVVQGKINQVIEKACEHSPPGACKKTKCHDENRVAEKRQLVDPGHKVANKVI